MQVNFLLTEKIKSDPVGDNRVFTGINHFISADEITNG